MSSYVNNSQKETIDEYPQVTFEKDSIILKLTAYLEAFFDS